MRIPLAATVLLATIVSNLGAPLNPISSKLHRESTKAILNLEQELKKAAGEDKKPRPEPEVAVPAEALADKELVKELAEHEDTLKDDGPQHQEQSEEDTAEVELQQEKEVAEKAAELKAKQEDESEKETEDDKEAEEKAEEEEEEEEEEQLKDASMQEPLESEEQPVEAQEEEEVAEEKEGQQPATEEEEEELQSLQVPSNINDLYEDYLNEQRQAYYEAKRSYGDALDNLAEQEDSKDMFVASLLETIREHPELLDEMRTGEDEERSGYNYNEARNDREEALRAEYLAATRGLAEPSQFESDPYQGRPYETKDVRPQQENYQNYPSDKMAKVVAKKWGYSPPVEYYDLANNKENTGVIAPPLHASEDKKDHVQALDQPQHMEPIM